MLGLAITPTTSPSFDFITTLAANGVSPTFGLCLCPGPEEVFTRVGTVVFGGDPTSASSLYSGSFTTVSYTPDPVSGWYDIDVQSMSVQGGPTFSFPSFNTFEGGCSSSQACTIVDSGTPRVFLPASVWSGFAQYLTSQGYGPQDLFSVLSTTAPLTLNGNTITVSQFPTVVFNIMSSGSIVSLSMPPTSYLQVSGSTTVMTMMASEVPTIILGTMLFNTYYAVFDRNAQTISFAPISC